jgi:hypothetical protein
MATSEGGPPFKVSFNDELAESLRRLIWRGVVLGQADRLARAMAEIDTALQTKPRTWGDPVGKLSGMRMVRYRKIHDRLRVIYAAHVEQPVVWLLMVEPLRHHPLWIGEG